MNNMKKYNNGIYVGKFFPFQKGHMSTLETICNLCKKVYLVFFYTEESENKLLKQLDYSIDERIDDVKEIFKDKNVIVIKFKPSNNLKFPDDYIEIKNELLKELGLDYIDMQIFGKDDENLYKNYIYANDYIVGDNIIVDEQKLHATLIRKNYDKYKKYLHPIIRKRLDNKLNKSKYICVTGKSGSGKSTLAKISEKALEKSISIDIDKLAHEALRDNDVKENIIKLIGNRILDTNGYIDRKELGKIVFNNLGLKKEVYDITWKFMDNYIISVSEKNYNYIILDWYNIITKKYWDISTMRIIVERDYKSRKADVMKRDKITEEYFDLREKNGNNYDNIDFDYRIELSNKQKIDEIIKLLEN